jgi:hypothetical protein
MRDYQPQDPPYHFTVGDWVIMVVLGIPVLGAILESLFN